jgi:hypothetical protein
VAPLTEGMPHSNGGALAMAAVLVALALVGAVGALEKQEI